MRFCGVHYAQIFNFKGLLGDFESSVDRGRQKRIHLNSDKNLVRHPSTFDKQGGGDTSAILLISNFKPLRIDTLWVNYAQVFNFKGLLGDFRSSVNSGRQKRIHLNSGKNLAPPPFCVILRGVGLDFCQNSNDFFSGDPSSRRT